jgi:ATP-dependent helicase HepA
MLEAFERGGLDVEALGKRSYAVRAGLDYHRPFPGFSGREMAVTFDRDTALARPDRALLTWDHPLVRDCLDSLFEVGNAGVARCVGEAPGLLLEALYVAEPTIARKLRADRFLPPTPIRVLVDMNGREVEHESRALRERLEPVDSAVLELPQVGESLPGLLERAREIATGRGSAIAAAAREHMRAELEPVVARLVELAQVNPSVGREEIDVARGELAALDQGLRGVRVRLDGLRLILVDAE